MICPNCKTKYPSGHKFCPTCEDENGMPIRLVDEQQTTSGFNINLGDANAISGGVNLSDSHNVHNEDKSVHNISNVSTVTHNVTQVAAQKTEMELLQEKKTLYLNECKRAYEDNVLEQAEVVVLEEYRIKIGLDKATADAILDSVRVMTERNARKTSLNPIAKTKLKILTDNLKKNEVKALMDQIDGLEALVNKYEHDELSRKYFLVLAALKPEKCINLKENSKIDSYWKSYWSYLAYIKVGRSAEAENVLVSLDRFADYPEDNMTVLAVAGALMNGNNAEAKEYLDSVMGDYTPALQRFVDSIYLLLDPEMAKEMSADANTCAFYLVNFFNQEDPKERARKEAAADERARKEAEAKRKAEEEARIKAEQETKTKAEEEARIKAEQEAKAKAEEEVRIKAEQEAKAKAEEEARIKAEQETKTKAEEEARIKAEQEAKAKAEEEARIKAEQEAKRKAEEEARIKAEQEAKVEQKNKKRIPDTACLSDEEYFEWSRTYKIIIKDEYKPYIKHIIVDKESGCIEKFSCERITVNDICRKLACRDNESLVTIDGGVNLERIDLRGCDNLNYSIEDGIKYYGTWAIEVIDKTLTTYRLRENTTLLNEYLFDGCKQLHHITIPDKIAKISFCCFRGSGLTMIDLPENITGLDSFAFKDCKQLREMHIRHPRIGTDFSSPFSLPLKNITFYVPKDSLSYYKRHSAFKGKLFSGVKIIGE